MKKYIFLIIIILLAGCAKKPVYQTIPVKDRSATLSLTNINVGTTPNDGTGQTIRSAFQTINTNNDLTEAAIATVPTIEEVRQTTNDSINDLKEKAIPSSSILFLREDADTPGEAVTYEGMVNYVAANGGTGGGGGYEWTSFIVGTTTGAPANGDTTITIADMAGDVIEVYRGTTSSADLPLQALNETPTNAGVPGYRYNSSGLIAVLPAWATDDRAYIKAVPSSGVKKVSLPEGASSLITGLRAYWPMNETTGTQVNDYLDTYDGTTTAVVGASGKFGYAEQFIAANDDMASFGTTVGDVGTSDFSIACWVYVPETPAGIYGVMGNWGSTPYYYLSINEADYKALFYWNFGSGAQELTSNLAIPVTTWTHIAVTVDRSGNALMYINGTLQTDTEDVSEDVAVAGDNNNIFNVGSVGGNHTVVNANMTIDETAMWLKVLTQEEVTELQTSAIN